MSTSPPPRESLNRLGRLVRKELIEIIRDRRTIITLVLMPLLLYPLMSVAFQQFFLASSIDPGRGVVYRLGFATKEDAEVFAQFVMFGERIIQSGQSTAPSEKPLGKAPQWLGAIPPDLEQALLSGEIDLAVQLKSPALPLRGVSTLGLVGSPLGHGPLLGAAILVLPRATYGFHLPLARDMLLEGDLRYLSNKPTALAALAWVERRLAAVHERNLEMRLHLPGAEPKVALLHMTRWPVAASGSDSMISLAALVPLILILMTITGAVYPAIDLTAGERERGTLEILVAAPVPRLGLLFAKYVSVFFVAVLTAFVNLVAMMLTLVLSGLSQVLFAEGLSALLVLQLFGLLLLFAAFFSALLLSLTSFARSFKEAQAYLIPLMLASLGPGLIGMMPGLELDGPLAATPLVNIVLLARDLVKGVAEPAWALVVVLTTLAYAAAAIGVAARVFGAEGVLYNEQTGWSDLLRRPSEPQPTATVASALWCLALMIPTHFVLQWLVRLPGPELPRTWQYAAMAIVALLLFGALPAFAAFLGRVRWRSGFGLARPGAAALVGGLLLGLSLWPWVLEIVLVLVRDRSQELRTLLESELRGLGRDQEVLMGVLIVQALVEELFFRGYLFGALRGQLSAAAAIGTVAVLFGVMHVAFGGPLGWQRLVPSTLLGLVLGWVRCSAGSVIPAMLLHACHNALLPRVVDMEMGQHISWQWLAAGAVGSLVGTACVWLDGVMARRRQRCP